MGTSRGGDVSERGGEGGARGGEGGARSGDDGARSGDDGARETVAVGAFELVSVSMRNPSGFEDPIIRRGHQRRYLGWRNGLFFRSRCGLALL